MGSDIKRTFELTMQRNLTTAQISDGLTDQLKPKLDKLDGNFDFEKLKYCLEELGGSTGFHEGSTLGISFRKTPK